MSSNFLQFNPTQANQENDAAYLIDATRTGGAGVDAVWPSTSANKTLYQLSTAITALMQMMANKGFTVSDANLATLTSQLMNILTTADLLGNLQSVAYAGSIALNAAAWNGFQIALAGNTSLTISGQTAGQVIVIIFVQDGSGGHTVTYPGNILGAVQPDPTASAISAQAFKVDAALNLVPISPSMSTDSTGRVATPATNDNSTRIATTAWNLLGFLASISSAHGYVALPTWLGGWIIQWGTDGPLPTGSYDASLAIAFPNAALFTSTPRVFCQTDNRADNADGSAPYVLNAGPISITTSGFTAIASCNTVIGGHGAASISNTVNINWFAIGN